MDTVAPLPHADVFERANAFDRPGTFVLTYFSITIPS
jgi:hypothetical protein